MKIRPVRALFFADGQTWRN